MNFYNNQYGNNGTYQRDSYQGQNQQQILRSSYKEKSPLRNQPQSPLLQKKQSSQHSQPSQNNPEKIQLIIRIRPILEQQQEDNEEFITLINNNSLKINKPGSSLFMKFSDILDHQADQIDLYEKVNSNINSFFSGINSAIFAYGQTGSGKTFSILGELYDEFINTQALQYLIGEKRGILPRILQQIIHEMNNEEFNLYISFYEVYNEKIYDLFTEEMFYKDELEIRENKNGEVTIQDLKQVQVQNLEQAMETLSIGLQNRITGCTAANKQSSRSHSIFQLKLYKKQTGTFVSSMKICDLAGSEKYKIPKYLTQEEKDIRLQELTSINGSLSALGNCIQALTDKNRKHIPFRNSKLTRVLSDCLSGEGKITFIICVSPSISHSQETFSTLQFADRARKVILDGRNLQNVYKQYQEQQRNKLEQEFLNNCNFSNMVPLEQFEDLKLQYEHEKNQRIQLESILEKIITQQQFQQQKQQFNDALSTNGSPLKQQGTVMEINKYLIQQNQYLQSQIQNLQNSFQQSVQNTSTTANSNNKNITNQQLQQQFNGSSTIQSENLIPSQQQLESSDSLQPKQNHDQISSRSDMSPSRAGTINRATSKVSMADSQYNTNKFAYNFWELNNFQNNTNLIDQLKNTNPNQQLKQLSKEKQQEIQKQFQQFLEQQQQQKKGLNGSLNQVHPQNQYQQQQQNILNDQVAEEQMITQINQQQEQIKEMYQQQEDQNDSYQQQSEFDTDRNDHNFNNQQNIQQENGILMNGNRHQQQQINNVHINGIQQQQQHLQQNQYNNSSNMNGNGNINSSNQKQLQNGINNGNNSRNKENIEEILQYQPQAQDYKLCPYPNKDLQSNFQQIMQTVNVRSSNVNNIVTDLKYEMNKAMNQLQQLQREDDELDTQH